MVAAMVLVPCRVVSGPLTPQNGQHRQVAPDRPELRRALRGRRSDGSSAQTAAEPQLVPFDLVDARPLDERPPFADVRSGGVHWLRAALGVEAQSPVSDPSSPMEYVNVFPR